ncbi:MAG: LacI family DNA-binding transcriptional regulator [Ktedonobacteraceae bacterium]|nr:LacI family DNA-binding transcriptional regulator [Ktedonobacteraceae bacterium]
MGANRRIRNSISGRRPLQREIAAATNVSISTVSRVLNRSGTVSADIRERVLTTAMELGYPSVTQGVENITLFLALPANTVAEHYAALVSTGVVAECRAHGIQLSQMNVEQEPGATDFILDKIKHSPQDGFLFLSYDDRDLLDALCKFSNRAILINTDKENIGLDTFLPANTSGASIAVQYLMQQGHREILYIGNSIRQTLKRRYDGYRTTLEKAGIAYNPDLVLMQKTRSKAPTMYEEIKSFLAGSHPSFTAVACFNDIAAISAIRALREEGLRIPQDVSVVGFDDSELCMFVDPPLTTVRIEWAEIGKLAVRRLLERAKEPGLTPIRVEVQCRLIERQSVAPFTSIDT